MISICLYFGVFFLVLLAIKNTSTPNNSETEELSSGRLSQRKPVLFSATLALGVTNLFLYLRFEWLEQILMVAAEKEYQGFLNVFFTFSGIVLAFIGALCLYLFQQTRDYLIHSVETKVASESEKHCSSFLEASEVINSLESSLAKWDKQFTASNIRFAMNEQMLNAYSRWTLLKDRPSEEKYADIKELIYLFDT